MCAFPSFKNIKTNYTDDQLLSYDVGLYRLDIEQITSLEPTFALQFPVSRLKWIRGHAQVGAAILFEAPTLHYRPVLGGIGFTIAPLIKPKKIKNNNVIAGYLFRSAVTFALSKLRIYSAPFRLLH